MPDGTGLKRFRNMYPDRFFDVGIAEEHAVTFAAGLAAGGLIPVVAVYSSFLQRSYDQIIHDVCIQDLHVIFAIDRAGIVGADGETHQGIFDISYLSTIPNMHIMAPKNKWELSDMMKFAAAFGHPIAIRYPRGLAYDGLQEYRQKIELGRGEPIFQERQIALFALGSMVRSAQEIREGLKAKGYGCSLYNARFAKPLDEEMLRDIAGRHELVVSLEENVETGGFGESVRRVLDENGARCRFMCVALPDAYVEHGNVELLKKEVGLDTASITERIIKKLEEET
jgi:1-deoxy-D-xylulose-5-phosphate synthase